jgi:transposase InsO family protein
MIRHFLGPRAGAGLRGFPGPARAEHRDPHQHRPESLRQLRDKELTKMIRVIHAESRGGYGSPRVHAELRLGLGEKVNRKRVERLTRQAGLRGISITKRNTLHGLFGKRLRDAGLLGSMGTIGDCHDNAMMQSPWGKIQLELLDGSGITTLRSRFHHMWKNKKRAIRRTLWITKNPTGTRNSRSLDIIKGDILPHANIQKCPYKVSTLCAKQVKPT